MKFYGYIPIVISTIVAMVEKRRDRMPVAPSSYLFCLKFVRLGEKSYLCRSLVNYRLMTEENTIEIEILGEEVDLLVAF